VSNWNGILIVRRVRLFHARRTQRRRRVQHENGPMRVQTVGHVQEMRRMRRGILQPERE